MWKGFILTVVEVGVVAPCPPLSHSPLGPLRNPLLSILQSPNKPLEDSTLVSNQQPPSQM